MLPNMPTPEPAGPMMGPPGGGAEGAPGPGEIRKMLRQVIVNAKRLAEENGLNFAELVAEAESGAPEPPGPAMAGPPGGMPSPAGPLGGPGGPMRPPVMG